MIEPKFKVGDEVFCNTSGHGVIVAISGHHMFPITVQFENTLTATYTLNGNRYAPDTIHLRKLTKLEKALK